MPFFSFLSWCLVALVLSVSPSLSAILSIDENGQLRGAKGVLVEYGYEQGSNIPVSFYVDVEFKTGSCAAVFNGCENSAFHLGYLGAPAAIAAVRQQVLVDGPLGSFGSDAGLIFGIPAGTPGVSLVAPIQIAKLGSQSDGYGFLDLSIDGTWSDPLVWGPDWGTLGPNSVWAVFSFGVDPVPLPAGGALLLTGLGLVAGVRFRDKSVS